VIVLATFITKDLANAVAVCNKFAGSKSVIQSHALITFRPNDEKASLTTKNGLVECEKFVKYEGELFEFAVDCATLNSFLKSAKGAKVSIEVAEKSTLVKCGSAKLLFEIPTNNITVSMNCENALKMSVSTEALKDVVSKIAFATSKETETAFNLQAVYLHNQGSQELRAMCTDTGVLIYTGIPFETSEEIRLLVNAKTLSTVLSSIEPDSEMLTDTKVITFLGETTRISCLTLSGEPLDYTKPMQRKPKEGFVVNSEVFKEGFETVRSVCESHDAVSITFNEDLTLNFKAASSKGTQAECSVKASEGKLPNETYLYKVSNFDNLIRNFNGDYVFYVSENGVLYFDFQNYHGAIAPTIR